ncbi:hypothetical protein QYE76_061012 [Lolium multiflorum]|uniref:Uncharacterized protein n=1 Tax=Lolium multiflorum TaxID=4521 RepID=A0AAD8S0E7_LOLMU|nr:hypothetical protein QYE76_061012 [Lolium multiflorum]
MGRLVLITPHCCIPIPSRDHDQDLLCRGMEEVVDVRQQPPPTQPNPAAWRLFKIFVRCFTATVSIGMVVFAFVGRYFNLFPELQDPFTVALVLFIALIQVGSGFMITQGDVEANTVTDQGEQHL